LKDLRDAYSLDMTYEHGLKKAKNDGIAEGKLAVACNLIKEKLPVDIIARVTGLSIEEINAISLN
jgi:predicted transposase/invertase (TIGR01784 family)